MTVDASLPGHLSAVKKVLFNGADVTRFTRTADDTLGTIQVFRWEGYPALPNGDTEMELPRVKVGMVGKVEIVLNQAPAEPEPKKKGHKAHK